MAASKQAHLALRLSLMVLMLFLLLVLVIPYTIMFVVVCRHCNRVGNFLDTWFQRSLVEQLADGLPADEPDCPKYPVLHVGCTQRGLAEVFRRFLKPTLMTLKP